MISPSVTISRDSLGISRPMVDLPDDLDDAHAHGDSDGEILARWRFAPP